MILKGRNSTLKIESLIFIHVMTLEEKLKAFAPQLEMMPGISVIHEIDEFKPLFMTSNGLKLLGLSLEELIAIKEDYQKLFFNQNFMNDYLVKLESLMAQEETSETFTFFHQVLIKEKFEWYAASIKVFHSDIHGNSTHTITYAVPLEDYQWTIKRAQRLLDETEFARKNIQNFTNLSLREKEVLALAANGKRAAQIACSLGVTAETINSHLKSVKRKLSTHSSHELTEYALAFDLL